MAILSFLLNTIFIFSCLLLILVILIQKGKGSMGMGGLGGGSQMLFGGSGGQDIFQKTTWILGTIFIVGSLVLSLMKTQERQNSRFVSEQIVPEQNLPEQN